MKKLQSKSAAVLLALLWGLGSVTSLNAETANPSSQKRQSTDQAEAKQKEKDNFGLKPHPRLADDPSIIDMPGHLKLRPLDLDRRDITGIIVRLRENAHSPKIRTLSPKEMGRIKGAAGIELRFGRASWGNSYLLELPREMSKRETEETARRIESLPEVEYAVANDTGFGLQAVPNDPHFGTRQWSLKSDTGGMKVDKAWDLTTGASGIVVAVIDGGILATHEDIVGRLVGGTPADYDFVTNTLYSNDGDGRDADPSDPGDWVSAEEAGIGLLPVARPAPAHDTARLWRALSAPPRTMPRASQASTGTPKYFPFGYSENARTRRAMFPTLRRLLHGLRG